jgi:hypothetical protein
MMAGFDPVSAIFGVANQVIARVWPDPADQAKAAQALAELQQKGDLAFLDADVQLMTGQMRINEKEAEHGGLFQRRMASVYWLVLRFRVGLQVSDNARGFFRRADHSLLYRLRAVPLGIAS